MIVYQKKLRIFLSFLIFFSIGLFVLFGVFDDIQQLRRTGGLIVPEHFFGGGHLGIVGSLLLILGAGSCGVFCVFVAGATLKIWARIKLLPILIMNAQGIFLRQLKPGTIIPWRDVEGHETVVTGRSFGKDQTRIILKTKNKEQYLKKNWTGSYPDVVIGLYDVTETPEAICQYIDNALAGRFPPIVAVNVGIDGVRVN